MSRFEGRNLKGRDYAVELGPITLIYGANAAGKTAIIQGIVLALNGCLPPPLGKARQRLYQLAGGADQPGEMEVAVVFADTGTRKSLSLHKRANGSVSLEAGGLQDPNLTLPTLAVEASAFFAQPTAEQSAWLAARAGCCLSAEQVRALAGESRPELSEAIHRQFPGGVSAEAIPEFRRTIKDLGTASLAAAKTAEAQIIALRQVNEPRSMADVGPRIRELQEVINGLSIPAELEAGAAASTERVSSLRRAIDAITRCQQIERRPAVCPTCGQSWPSGPKMNEAANERRAAQAAALQEQLAEAREAAASAAAALETARQTTMRTRQNLNVELTELLVVQAAQAQHRHAAGKLRELEQQALAHRRSHGLWVEFGGAVEEEWSRLIASAMERLLAPANEMLAGLLASPLEIRDGELGRRMSAAEAASTHRALEAGSWISHEVFSATEQLLSYMAYVWALSSAAPLRIVLLDELGRLTPDLQRELMRRATQWVREGRIHQFIGAMAAEKMPRGMPEEIKLVEIV
jgi:hypothetical protein